MDDKELVELAAKAAGMDFINEYSYVDRKGIYVGIDEHWNPLTDDGNALRLAVKLHIYLDFNVDNVEADGAIKVKYETNPYAATRRAIVQAAAEIGRSMK